ncbi:MAG: murein L,D-transpeptidase catalytic domain family protein [Ginsengibacter sp.]
MQSSFKNLFLVLIPFLLFLIHLPFVSANVKPITMVDLKDAEKMHTMSSEISSNAFLYESLDLQSLGLSEDAFEYALKGYEFLKNSGKLENDDILSIVDFSLPSSKKRLFVLDMENGQLLYHTFVAHGRNSGREFANQFSNRPESFKSSLGFYVTKNTYFGKHGFSLRLEGKEKGINDNAMKRAIVMHSADYVDKKLISSQGYIGRSLGCPALPREVYKPIINKIKDGSCLFIYSPGNYAEKSPVLQLAGL